MRALVTYPVLYLKTVLALALPVWVILNGVYGKELNFTHYYQKLLIYAVPLFLVIIVLKALEDQNSKHK